MSDGYSLDDKYLLDSGRVAMTGIQALVRLPIVQSRLDLKAGYKVGTFITGYQGSPLGEYDKQLARTERILSEHNVIWQPGINEEVAATALYGAQLLGTFPHENYDGVVSIWYGKTPGVDRTGDAFRHGNFLGTGPMGGAVALAGDDLACKSSTIPGDSTVSFYDLSFPVFYPGDPAEVIDLGLHAIAMSRYSGLWTALKIVTNVADGGALVDLNPPTPRRIPDFKIDGTTYRKSQDIRLLPPWSLEMERQIYEDRTQAAHAYARANEIDKVTVSTPEDRIGLVAAGKTYRDLLHALDILELGDEELHRFGIRLYKPALISPLEPESLRTFAAGLSEIIVIEDKRGFIETQIRDLLYNLSSRPLVYGKRDAYGRTLFPSHGELLADQIAVALAGALADRLRWPALRDRVLTIEEIDRRDYSEVTSRTPYFCSGCPHNSSTILPEGSDHAGGGIGCHAMALWMDRGISWLPQMGGEGACWLGLSPFTEKEHVFQNVGDGTFAHSASKSLEACVAADVNITFRILYNSAVAMTGGQDVVGLSSPLELARQLEAQGVKRIVLVTDEVEQYDKKDLGPRTDLQGREQYDKVMKELRDISGVTVIIFDQQCAAEKRRERKRGIQETPKKRIFINESVCEGCGDCGTKSNCLSVMPVETEFGRKTRIHQSSCNMDYSCLEGDCPSFMTVELSSEVQKTPVVPIVALDESLPDPDLPSLASPHQSMLIGIGGTGVVTVDALLVTATLLDGNFAVHLDQTGLSQKGGAVLSNLIVSDKPILRSSKISAGEADLVLAFDVLAAASPDNLRRCESSRTTLVANTSLIPTAQTIVDISNPQTPVEMLQKSMFPFINSKLSHWIDAESICQALFGDSVAVNVFLVGVAFQLGKLPISSASIEKAIELNGVQVEKNIAAFRWGRTSIEDRSVLEQKLAPTSIAGVSSPEEKLSRFARKSVKHFSDLVELVPDMGDLKQVASPRIAELILFQNPKTAESYATRVVSVAEIVNKNIPGNTMIAEAFAEGLYKLTAIKDEYEVSRLWLQDSVYSKVSDEFEGKVRRSVHLHPPFLRRLGMHKKLVCGPWIFLVFKLLYSLRWLRGTRFDFFGYTKHRRLEHSLSNWYQELVMQGLKVLDSSNQDVVHDLCMLADRIRGYEDIKEGNVKWAKDEAERLLDKLKTEKETESQQR